MPCIYAHLASSGNTELLIWRARTKVVRANLGELASLLEQRRLSTTDRNGEYHMPVQIAGPHRIGRAAAEAPTQAIMRPALAAGPWWPRWSRHGTRRNSSPPPSTGCGSQTRPPDLIVVIANNCTDDTAGAARAAGAEVIEMPHNPHRKGGALNYGIETLLASLADKDRIFVMDADTVIVPALVRTGRRRRWTPTRRRPWWPAGTRARPQYGLIGLLQRAEFARECRMIDRRGDRTHILVGTSTLLPVAMLREVIAARREGRLPPGTCTCPDRRPRISS